MGEYFTMLTKCGLNFPVEEIQNNIVVLRDLKEGDRAFCNNGIAGTILSIKIQKNDKKIYKGKTDEGEKWQASNPIPSPQPSITYLIKRLNSGKFKHHYTIEDDSGIFKFVFDTRVSNLKDIPLRNNSGKGTYYNTFTDIRCIFLNLLCIYESGTIWNGKEKRFVAIR